MKKTVLSLIVSIFSLSLSYAQCPSGVNFSSSSPRCSGAGVDFTNTSNVGSGAAYSYLWEFDRGGVGGVNPTTSIQENPTGIIFSNATSYDVRLTITEIATGCKSNRTRTISINQTPSANFDADTSMSCTSPYSVNFKNTGSSGGGFSYAWDFGTDASPATSSSQNPNNIRYSSSGVKTIQFIITSGAGCDSDTSTKNINIYKSADAGYTTSLASATTGCIEEGINVYNTGTSSGGTFPVTYSWDFGSGSSPANSSLENPTNITYSSSGPRSISHTVTTGGTMSCSINTQTRTVTINPSPTITFTSTAPVCINNSVDFTNTGSTGTGYTYFWDFGSGASPATSTSQNPTGVIYSTAGTKIVTLTTTNQFGCVASATQSITINATPVASFTSTAPRCTGLGVDFTNTGTTSGVSYAWNFGSGATPATSASQDTTGVIYSTAGIKTVTLLVTNTTTNCAVTATNTITINQTPAVTFTSTAPVCMNTSVDFTNTGSTGGNWSYFWDLGKDAIPATSTSQNPTGVAYSTSGTKAVTFTVSDQNCTNTYSNTVTINATPIASFTSTAPRCTGLGVDFTNTGTTSGVSYAWNFGSGATPATSASQDTTGVIYSTAGIKTVTLLVTNTTTNCAVTATNTITINQTPTITFTSTAPVCMNTSVDFTNTGSTGGNWSYFWDLGKDAIPATSTSQNPAGVAYSTSGTKAVTFTVSDQNCTNTYSNTVTINATPVASFTSTAPRCIGLGVDFTNKGTTSGVSYAWDFGSGATPATSASQDTTGVVYSTAGIKTVTLTVTNTTTNCAVKATNTIAINQTPVVTFTSTAPVCTNSSVNFTNTGSTGGNWSYFWDLGKDAIPATSTSQNPTGVSYSTSGTKTVTFTISDQNCTNTYSNTVTINATPVASFTSTAPRCTGLGVDFTNKGTTSGVSYAWDFGSGATPATSASQDTTGVVYSTAGIKTVTLTVTNTTTNCAVTATNTLTINQTPAVTFTSTAPKCVSSGLNFINSGSTGSNWSYSWTFGKDALPATSTSENPVGVLFKSGGSKTITFTISDQNCTKTYSNAISINALPVVEASKDTTLCANTSVQIGTASTSNYTYSWFPANTLDNVHIANPTASPIAAITQYIVTVIDTITGCQNIDSVTVTMLTSLLTNAGVDVGICRYDSIQIGTGLIKGQDYLWTPGSGLSNATSSNPIASPDSTTTYTLTVTGSNCPAIKDEVTVTVRQLPDANAGADDTITKGSSVQLVATGGVQYGWSPSYGLDNTGIYNPIANPATTTNYVVTVTDIYGCIKTDSLTLTAMAPSVWLPNAFTPDNNGSNDVFYARGEGVQGFEFRIFNRWGETIFYSKDAKQGWDGRRQITGEELPEGAYIYHVKGTLTNGEELNLKGIVNLIR